MSFPLLVVGSVLKFEASGWATHILIEEVANFQKNDNIWTITFRGTNQYGVSTKEVIQTISHCDKAPFFKISYFLSTCKQCKKTDALSGLVVGSVLQYPKPGLTTQLLIDIVDNIKKTKVNDVDTWTRTFSGVDNDERKVRGKQTITRPKGSDKAPYFFASYTYNEVDGDLTFSQINALTMLKY